MSLSLFCSFSFLVTVALFLPFFFFESVLIALDVSTVTQPKPRGGISMSPK